MKFDVHFRDFRAKLLIAVAAIVILFLATELIFLYQEFHGPERQMMAKSGSPKGIHHQELSQ